MQSMLTTDIVDVDGWVTRLDERMFEQLPHCQHGCLPERHEAMAPPAQRERERKEKHCLEDNSAHSVTRYAVCIQREQERDGEVEEGGKGGRGREARQEGLRRKSEGGRKGRRATWSDSSRAACARTSARCTPAISPPITASRCSSCRRPSLVRFSPSFSPHRTLRLVLRVFIFVSRTLRCSCVCLSRVRQNASAMPRASSRASETS